MNDIFSSISWFWFSISATIFFGISMVFYKTPSFNGHSRSATSFWSFFVPFLLSLIFFFKYLPNTSSGMLILALLWGFSFACLVSFQMYALSHVDTNVLFPINTTASLVFSVLLGLLIFGGSLSILQVIGILLVILIVFCFVYKKGKFQYSPLVLKLFSAMLVFGVFNKLLQKFVADSFDIHAYLIYQYMFAVIFSLIIFFFLEKGDWKKLFTIASAKNGFLIGIFSFLGGYALLIALAKGPFALITSIHSLYIIITAILASFLFKEKLTLLKIILILLAILAIILIKIG